MPYRWGREAPGGPQDFTFPVPGQTPPLRRVLELNPDLRVLAQCGYHDTICHYYENVWAVRTLAPELRARFTVRTYDGGHEAYLSKASRRAMVRDLGAFITQALAQPTRP